jgi:hypothetical protein
MTVPSKNVHISSADASFFVDMAMAVSVGVSSPGLTPFVESQTILSGNDTFTFNLNGGILATSNTRILFLWENGTIDLSTVVVDRVAVPNTLTLSSPLDEDTLFTILTFV